MLTGILGGSAGATPYDTPGTQEDRHALTQEQPDERFYVVGFVKQPGSYRLTKEKMTVADAIAVAGGVRADGATDRFRISRQQDGQRVDLEVKADEPIRANDTISVFRKPR